MLFQEIQPDRNILCLQVHPVVSIGSHHPSGLIADQRIHIQKKYLLIIRQLCDFCISGFDSFVGDIVPVRSVPLLLS